MSCTSHRRAVSLACIPSINRWFLTVLAVFSLASSALVAADTAVPPGTVRGKILNASNGAYLENATVTIAGTNRQETTNNFGEYEFTNVPAGEITLVAKYVGEADIKATATVLGGAGIEQNFTFRETAETIRTKDGAIILDPFLVQTERYKNAAAIAIAEERVSVNMKNVVSTDAFGDIPSGNVGEFVKFLPGVQLSYGNYAGSSGGTSENTASGISIRGFGPEDTAIMIDGMPVSSAAPGSLSRQVGLDMLSITNASRVELIKVATPDMPANSIGGSVNLITKNAFEFAKPSYTAKVYFNFNSLSPFLGKSQGPVNKMTYKTTPGLDFSVSYPVSKTFGFTVSGHTAQEYDLNYRATPTWSYDKNAQNYFFKPTSTTFVYNTNTKGDMDISNPMMTRFVITDTPRMVNQTSGNIKLDWRPTPSQNVSANFQYSSYNGIEAQHRLDFVAQYQPLATNITATSTRSNFGGDFTTSFIEGLATSSVRGRAKADMTITTIDKVGDTKSGQIKYNLDLGGWRVQAAGSYSLSQGRYVDHANGHYSGMDFSSSPARVDFFNIVDGVPGQIKTYTTNAKGGGQFDYTDLSKWTIGNLIAQSAESYSRNVVGLYKLDVDRALDFIPFLGSNSLNFKFGGRRDQEITEKWGLGTGFRDVYIGATPLTALDILDTTYTGQSPGYGQPAQQWASTYKLYELNQANKIFATPGVGYFENEAVNNWNSYVGQQKKLTETTDAFYAQLSGKFFHNRLSFVGGMRQESKSRVGYGPYVDSKWNYAKKADGTLYREATGTYSTGVRFDQAAFLTDTALLGRLQAAGITAPTTMLGSTGASLASAKLFRQAKHPINDKLTGKPSASLSASYDLTKKIVLKAAWSKSFGLPALENGTNGVLSGNGAFTVNPSTTDDIDGFSGVINVANPGLPPTISNNLDFQVSYYTDSGGKFGVSFYTKTVTNQPMTFTTTSTDPMFASLLDALGLDAVAFGRYKVSTSSVSSTDQKTHGYEVEARQDFGFLGSYGRHFQIFASYTQKSLGQPQTPVPYEISTPNGNKLTLIPSVSTITLTANRFAGAGLQFSTERFSAQLRGTYRNDNEINRVLVVGSVDNFLRRFEPAETRIDFNASYKISKRYSVYLSGKDIFNASRKLVIRDDYGLLPGYAMTYDQKRFGVTWTIGVNGNF